MARNGLLTKLPVPVELTGLERKRLRKKLWYLSKRKTELKKREKWNRKAGHAKKKPDGPYEQKRVRVSVARRYVFMGGKCFFNSQLGFEMHELAEILAEFARVRQAVGMKC